MSGSSIFSRPIVRSTAPPCLNSEEIATYSSSGLPSLVSFLMNESISIKSFSSCDVANHPYEVRASLALRTCPPKPTRYLSSVVKLNDDEADE